MWRRNEATRTVRGARRGWDSSIALPDVTSVLFYRREEGVNTHIGGKNK